MEKSLDAEVRKKAEAERFARQQKADAELYERQQKAEAELYERQKHAEAKKFEIQQEAEAQKSKAEAELFTREQEARGIQSLGQAEAESIRAKGVAEADAMEKKAEAYEKYTGAAVAEMMIKILPEMAGKIAEPLAQIDKITIIGGGDSNGIDAVSGNVPIVMTKLFESMKEATGIDLSEIVRANSYDAKVTRNINVTGMPGIAGSNPVSTDEQDI